MYVPLETGIKRQFKEIDICGCLAAGRDMEKPGYRSDLHQKQIFSACDNCR